MNAVKSATASYAASKITLFGHDKDRSTYYLKEFPEWHYQELPNCKGINATHIRQNYFWDNRISTDLPMVSINFLTQFRSTPEFTNLQEEAYFVRNYRQSWSHSPYPPIFVTTDSVVTCQNHVLLIKRKFCPGKGLYALPGGFLEESEWVKMGLVRELLEETKIALDEKTLLSYLQTMRVFDYPDRSLIGRVITHSGYFALPGDFPHTTASDDASAVEWMPINTLVTIRDQFHDDHYQILQTILELT